VEGRDLENFTMYNTCASTGLSEFEITSDKSRKRLVHWHKIRIPILKVSPMKRHNFVHHWKGILSTIITVRLPLYVLPTVTEGPIELCSYAKGLPIGRRFDEFDRPRICYEGGVLCD
jgi:hypothetical protein